MKRLLSVLKKSNNKKLTVKESRKYLKEELAFVAPNNFVRLIDIIFNKEHLSIIQSRYEENFQAFHKENDFQQIIDRHKVSNQFFQTLYHDLMKQAEQLKEPLQNFSQDYVHLLETLKNVQNNRDDDLFVVGAGILGTVFAGPVGGMATREFLRGSNGLEAEMKRAIGKVYDGIILILKGIDACLGSMYKRLVYFHYVLWYGFLKQIKADLIDLGYDLKDINFETKKMTYTISKNDAKKLKSWFGARQKEVIGYLEEGDFAEANIVSQHIAQYFLKNDAAKKLHIINIHYFIMR